MRGARRDDPLLICTVKQQQIFEMSGADQCRQKVDVPVGVLSRIFSRCQEYACLHYPLG